MTRSTPQYLLSPRRPLLLHHAGETSTWIKFQSNPSSFHTHIIKTATYTPKKPHEFVLVFFLQLKHCTLASVVHLHSAHPLHSVYGFGHVQHFDGVNVIGDDRYELLVLIKCLFLIGMNNVGISLRTTNVTAYFKVSVNVLICPCYSYLWANWMKGNLLLSPAVCDSLFPEMMLVFFNHNISAQTSLTEWTNASGIHAALV